MADDVARLMLRDVIGELLEWSTLAKNAAAVSGSDFDSGRQFAIYEVICLLSQQADAFDIDRSSIGLQEFNPDRAASHLLRRI